MDGRGWGAGGGRGGKAREEVEAPPALEVTELEMTATGELVGPATGAAAAGVGRGGGGGGGGGGGRARDDDAGGWRGGGWMLYGTDMVCVGRPVQATVTWLMTAARALRLAPVSA